MESGKRQNIFDHFQIPEKNGQIKHEKKQTINLISQVLQADIIENLIYIIPSFQGANATTVCLTVVENLST